MKMTKRDALRILGLDGSAEFADIKLAYRKASAKYHPDRNPAGLEMMKMINAAWASLSDYVRGCVEVEAEVDIGDLGEEMNVALNAIIGLGLEIEICGSWIWVSGDTKPHKDILKANGFKWAPVKKRWHFSPSGKRSYSRGKYSMDEIRSKHGSVAVRAQERARLQA